MITLQADPLVEWDEIVESLTGQSDECQVWVQDNLLQITCTIIEETVTRPSDTDLTRIKSQTYSDGTFELTVDRTYPRVTDCGNPAATYKIIII